MIDLTKLEKYFFAKFIAKSLNFHFYAPPSAHNWNQNFGKLGASYSNDSNSLDSYQKYSKFVFKFMLGMATF